MTQQPNTGNTIAAIQTVRSCMSAMQQSMERSEHLPGIVGLYGLTGMGKSMAAAIAANTFQAYYIEMRSAWTRKAVFSSILKEIGAAPGRTIPEMLDQVCEELALSGKPLIIDEFDYAIDKNMIDVFRDIYEGSNAPMLIIGEDHLPDRILKKSKRFHNRVLHWEKAEKSNLSDALKLRDFYRQEVLIEDDLVEHILKHADGCVRLMCVNFDLVSRDTIRTGKHSVSREDWGDKDLYGGSSRGKRRGL